MNIFPSFLSVDPFLGRVDKHSLSQQTLMELLIEKIENADIICGSRENPRELSQWQGVYFNNNNEVIEIEWYFMDLEGIFELKWLPSTVQIVEMANSMMSGSVDLTILPDGLTCFSLPGNRFEGSIDLSHLPSSLRALRLHVNIFSGTVDLTRLPDELSALSLGENQFSGSLDLTKLPENMTELHLNKNQFCGETDFRKLPKEMTYLDISETKLAGEIAAFHPEGHLEISWSKVKDVRRK